MDTKRRIVAEVSTSWPKDDPQVEDLTASKFEGVIEANRQRGYVLESWQFQASPASKTPDKRYRLIETIIAVFVEQ